MSEGTGCVGRCSVRNRSKGLAVPVDARVAHAAHAQSTFVQAFSLLGGRAVEGALRVVNGERLSV